MVTSWWPQGPDEPDDGGVEEPDEPDDGGVDEQELRTTAARIANRASAEPVASWFGSTVITTRQNWQKVAGESSGRSATGVQDCGTSVWLRHF
jgi:hypothetical protein